MILSDLIDALVELFYSIIYKLFSCICVLIDFIKEIFYKLCGIETVNIGGEDTDLLSSLMGSDIIRRVFLSVLLIGVILLVVFTIIAIIKSNYQEKQNWKTVLTKTAQSLIILILIPFTVMAGIVLTNTVMSSINLSMQATMDGANATIGGQFLVTIGHDSFIGDAASRASIEASFINGTLDYNHLDTVKTYYDITGLNYLIGLLGGLVILVMFVLSALTFVQRIFDIILLYIVSPVSISTLPLDEGNRFKVWKDMLISKILSAYGIILVMNLFFLIIPQVYQIQFFENGFQNGVVYILFLIGGSFAVTKASRVISQLCGAQQTGGELAQMIYNIRSGIAFTRATTALVGGVVGGAVAGSDYLKSRKQGKGRMESLNASIHSNRNQKVVQEGAKKNKAKQIAGAPLRFATMPFGMLHDLASGGLIQVGKNFIPRLKNAATGDTLINRAEILSKVPKSEGSSTTPPEDTTTTTDTTSDRTETTILDQEDVARGVDAEDRTADTESDRTPFTGPTAEDLKSDNTGSNGGNNDENNT